MDNKQQSANRDGNAQNCADADLDRFDRYQQDVRIRAQSLSRAVAVVSGGALSVSVGVFARPDAPVLGCWARWALIVSWWALFASLVLLTLVPFIVIARDYRLGELWRARRQGERADDPDHIPWVDRTIWGSAIAGYLAFVVGLLGLAVAATSLI